MSMLHTSEDPKVEPSVVSVRFFCHICGGSEADELCSALELREQLDYLRRFHRRRLKHPQESTPKDRAEFTQSYSTNIVACRGCGLVCRSPRPPAGSITETYSADRYGEEHLRSEFALQHEWAQSKAQALDARLREDASSAPFVVEVGSFVGGFLAAGRERGWKMMGVDPGKEVAAFCRNRKLEVFTGTLVEAPVAPGTADAVTIWNTFDQLPNPDSTLAAARQMLREDGVLVIRVPNGSAFRLLLSWQHRCVEPVKGWVTAALAWNNLLGFPYLYGYTVPTMNRLMARHGFAPLGIRPDTLMTVANKDTAAWARWEERLVKWTSLALARLEQTRHKSAQMAPWLDLYYRPVPSVADSPISVARASRPADVSQARRVVHQQTPQAIPEERTEPMASPMQTSQPDTTVARAARGILLLLLAGWLTVPIGTVTDPPPVPKPGPGPTDPVPRPPDPRPEPPLPGPTPPLPSPVPPP